MLNISAQIVPSAPLNNAQGIIPHVPGILILNPLDLRPLPAGVKGLDVRPEVPVACMHAQPILSSRCAHHHRN